MIQTGRLQHFHPARAHPAQISRHTYALAGLRSTLTAAVLADMHYGPHVGLSQVGLWVNQTLDLDVDVILLLGDYLDVNLSRGHPEPFLAELARLQAPLGVYGVWGNHDYGSFGIYTPGQRRAHWRSSRQAFGRALSERSIRILRDEGITLRPDLQLGGVDDLTWGQPDAARAFSHLPAGSARLLLSHQPAYLQRQLRTVAQLGIGLVLSGHTHGGQVRLPGLMPAARRGVYGSRSMSGDQPDMVTSGPAGTVIALTTRGLGTMGLPFRYQCASEIMLLHLQPVTPAVQNAAGFPFAEPGSGRRTVTGGVP